MCIRTFRQFLPYLLIQFIHLFTLAGTACRQYEYFFTPFLWESISVSNFNTRLKDTIPEAKVFSCRKEEVWEQNQIFMMPFGPAA